MNSNLEYENDKINLLTCSKNNLELVNKFKMYIDLLDTYDSAINDAIDHRINQLNLLNNYIKENDELFRTIKNNLSLL